jgi:RNA polymerase sigma-54 factor
MALEIKQSLKLSQQLVMTPQLQQAIKLLQLNRLELADVITQELMENPMLEEVAETIENPEGLPENATDQERDQVETENASVAEPSQETPGPEEAPNKEEFDWESYIDEVNNQKTLPSTRVSGEDLPTFENMLTRSTSLQEHLLWQLNMSNFTDEEKKLGLEIIGNLNDDGYLAADLTELARNTSIQMEDAEEILKMMQNFDPVGVAARSVQECLMVQAKFMKPRDELVESIIEHHLGDLEKRNYQAICKALDADIPDIVGCTQIIQQFEPKPGRLFAEPDNTQYITPDIYVVKTPTASTSSH